MPAERRQPSPTRQFRRLSAVQKFALFTVECRVEAHAMVTLMDLVWAKKQRAAKKLARTLVS